MSDSITKQLFEQVIKQTEADTAWQAYTVDGPARKLTLEMLYATNRELENPEPKRYELSPQAWAFVEEVGWDQAMKDVAEWIRKQEEKVLAREVEEGE